MMPPPHIPIDIPLQRLEPPLRIQQQEPPTRILEAIDKFLLGPKLHIIDEQHHMHSSPRCFDELEERGVSGGRRVYCVGGDPEVFLALVDHLPHPLEEGIALDDELSVREPFNLFQVPC